jgi:hypothetical protein
MSGPKNGLTKMMSSPIKEMIKWEPILHTLCAEPRKAMHCIVLGIRILQLDCIIPLHHNKTPLLNLTHRLLAIILTIPKYWNFASLNSQLQNRYNMPAKADRW